MKKIEKYNRNHSIAETAEYARKLGLTSLAQKLDNASFEIPESRKGASMTEIAMRTNELEKSNPRITLDLMKALTEKEELPKSQHERTAKRLAWQALHLGRPRDRENALLELRARVRKEILEKEE